LDLSRLKGGRSIAESFTRAQRIAGEIRHRGHPLLPLRLQLEEAPERPFAAGDVDPGGTSFRT
jgi:hypothetical protein